LGHPRASGPWLEPHGHVVLHHGALFEVVPDGVHMIWEGHLEKLLEVIGRLPRLALEIALGDSDMFLIGVVRLLAIVIIITSSSNCDLLVMPLLSLLTAIGASLSAFAGSLEWCPWLPSGSPHYPGRRQPRSPLHQMRDGWLCQAAPLWSLVDHGRVHALGCGS
jgi:hypothetical protein